MIQKRILLTKKLQLDYWGTQEWLNNNIQNFLFEFKIIKLFENKNIFDFEFNLYSEEKQVTTKRIFVNGNRFSEHTFHMSPEDNDSIKSFIFQNKRNKIKYKDINNEKLKGILYNIIMKNLLFVYRNFKYNNVGCQIYEHRKL